MTSAWEELPPTQFGDSAALADELLRLILAEVKTATCWPVGGDGPIPFVGQKVVALDGQQRPRAVLETVALDQCAFDRVDAEFAWAEGEGDRSLAYWQHEHRRYFERNDGFRPDMPLWCERFQLVAVLPSG